MANKVLTLNVDSDTTYLGLTYVDIDMKSRFYSGNPLVLLDDKDFMSFLGVEQYKDLSVIATEYSHDELIRIYYSEYLNNLIQNENLMLSGFLILKIVDYKAILNSLHNIFTWIQGERIILPEFGSRIKLLLYEGLTKFNQEQIIAEIRSCITEWEPRVNIVNIVNLTDTESIEDNTVKLLIIYRVPMLELANTENKELTYTIKIH